MEASSIQRVDHSKSTVLIGGGTGERETGCTRVPHSGGSRVEVIIFCPRVCPERRPQCKSTSDRDLGLFHQGLCTQSVHLNRTDCPPALLSLLGHWSFRPSPSLMPPMHGVASLLCPELTVSSKELLI